MTFLNHIYNTNTWVVSDKWFKKQSPENQRMIIENARAAILYSRGMAAHLSELAVVEAKKQGMEINYIDAEEMAKFKQLATEGYRKWAVGDFGLNKQLLDDIDQEIARVNKAQNDEFYRRYGQ